MVPRVVSMALSVLLGALTALGVLLGALTALSVPLDAPMALGAYLGEPMVGTVSGPRGALCGGAQEQPQEHPQKTETFPH